MSKLRLMTQNQWNQTSNLPFWESIGMDCSSAVRSKGHVRVAKELMPDIIGGQEINIDMQQDFKFYCMDENLPYTIIWGNMTPLIYRADKLELLDTEYIVYPEKIEGLPGEYNDVKSKAANLGVFRCKDDGKVFIFVTTHRWWMSEDVDKGDGSYREGSNAAREFQIKMLIDLAEKYQAKYDNCPIFVVGDLNTKYNTKVVQYALNERGFSHAHDIATDYACETNGMHDCYQKSYTPDWDPKPFTEAIDHILVKDLGDGVGRRFERYTPEYYLPLSDHAPAYIDVEI